MNSTSEIEQLTATLEEARRDEKDALARRERDFGAMSNGADDRARALELRDQAEGSELLARRATKRRADLEARHEEAKRRAVLHLDDRRVAAARKQLENANLAHDEAHRELAAAQAKRAPNAPLLVVHATEAVALEAEIDFHRAKDDQRSAQAELAEALLAAGADAGDADAVTLARHRESLEQYATKIDALEVELAAQRTLAAACLEAARGAQARLTAQRQRLGDPPPVGIPIGAWPAMLETARQRRRGGSVDPSQVLAAAGRSGSEREDLSPEQRIDLAVTGRAPRQPSERIARLQHELRDLHRRVEAERAHVAAEQSKGRRDAATMLRVE